MPAGRQTTDSAPAGITVLAERWDPDVIDLPDGRALIRLEVAGETAWDARVHDLELELAPANEEREPDAVIAADPDTWRRIAEDPRGAMGAFRQTPPADARQPARGGRLPRRHRGLARPGTPRLRPDRDEQRPALARIRRHRPRDAALPARPRRDQGVVPAHARGARRRGLPRDRARPAGLRRVRQADRRPLRRALVRARDLRGHGRARARVGPPRRQQHGRPRR